MNPPPQTAQAVNVSLLLIILCSLPLFAFFIYIIVNSPVFTPVYKKWADRAMKKKKYAQAAKLYMKLHFFQHQLEGLKYARAAAQAYELNGNLSQAQDAYREAEEWAKLGQMLIESGKFAQAIELFQEHQLYTRLAQAYELQEDFLMAGKIHHHELNNLHKAESFYKRAQRHKDTETRLSAQLFLSLLFHQMNRSDESQEILSETESEINSNPQFQEFPDLLKLRERILFQIKPLNS